MAQELVFSINDRYKDYLSDESRLIGKAQSISFPGSEAEAAEIISAMGKNEIPVTAQGAKTGLVGGAVPESGHILNLSRMNRVNEYLQTETGSHLLKVEPGITLQELRKVIKTLKSERELFWPPDPTETSATLGGIASSNAKGLTAALYGETSEHIEAVRIMQADGKVKTLSRGKGRVSLMSTYRDLFEVILGGEGIFGLLTGLTLRLQPRPAEMWGFMFFFENRQDLFKFSRQLMETGLKVSRADLAAAEYLDRSTIELLIKYKERVNGLKEGPAIPADTEAMLYLEVHSRAEDVIEEVADVLMEMAVQHSSDPDRTWVVTGEAEIEKLRAIRHGAVECVNLFADEQMKNEPQLKRLEAYLYQGNSDLEDVVAAYEADLNKEGLKGAMFGHVTGSHLRANILAEDILQYEKGLRILEQWARQAAYTQGTVDLQHGIGKLKRNTFLRAAPSGYVRSLQKVKEAWDPKKIWNPGNVI